MIDDPDVYARLQREHVSAKTLPKRLSEGFQRIWPEARGEHVNGCTGCSVCGTDLHSVKDMTFLKRWHRVGGDDPMLEFKNSDCFIKEYFRCLREDIMEPLPTILGSEMHFCTANIQAMRNRCFFTLKRGEWVLGLAVSAQMT